MRYVLIALALSLIACGPEDMSPTGDWRTRVTFTAPQDVPVCDILVGPGTSGGLFSLVVDDHEALVDIHYDDVEYRDVASLSIDCSPSSCYLTTVYGAVYHENGYTTTVAYTYRGRALDDDQSITASGQVAWYAVDDRTGAVEYECVGAWTGTGDLRQI